MSCLHLASPERQRPNGVNQINAFDDRECTLRMDEMRKHEKKNIDYRRKCRRVLT